MAIDRATWQGEPVGGWWLAEDPRSAEDALALVEVDWEAAARQSTDTEDRARLPGTPLIHPELGDNLCFQRTLDTGLASTPRVQPARRA